MDWDHCEQMIRSALVALDAGGQEGSATACHVDAALQALLQERCRIPISESVPEGDGRGDFQKRYSAG